MDTPKSVVVKAVGGATKWGIANIQEIRLIDPLAKKTDDGHAVILSDGRIVKPGDTVEK